MNLFQDGQTDDVVLSGELAQQMANDPAFVSQKEASTQYMELNQRDENHHLEMRTYVKQFLTQSTVKR